MAGHSALPGRASAGGEEDCGAPVEPQRPTAPTDRQRKELDQAAGGSRREEARPGQAPSPGPHTRGRRSEKRGARKQPEDSQGPDVVGSALSTASAAAVTLGTCRKDRDVNWENSARPSQVNKSPGVQFPHLQNEKLGLISKSSLALKNAVIL